MTAIGSTTAVPASAPRLTQMEQVRQAAAASAERDQQARRAAAGAPPSSTSPYGMTGDPEIAAARTK